MDEDFLPANRPWGPSGDWGDSDLWTSGVWGHPKHTIGTTATPAQIQGLRRIIAEWKPAGTQCEWIVVAFDDTKFSPADGTPPNPNGEYGRWGKNVAGSYVVARETTARYITGAEA